MGVRRVFSRGLSVDGSRLPTPPQQSARSLGSGWDGLREWLLGWLRAGYAPKSVTPQIIIAERDAARLFGWGVVAAPAAVGDAAPTKKPDVLHEKDVDSPESLVSYRVQFKDMPPQKRPHWTPEQRVHLPAAVVLHGSALKLADKLGVTYEAIRAQQQKAKAEAAPKPSSPFNWRGHNTTGA